MVCRASRLIGQWSRRPLVSQISGLADRWSSRPLVCWTIGQTDQCLTDQSSHRPMVSQISGLADRWSRRPRVQSCTLSSPLFQFFVLNGSTLISFVEIPAMVRTLSRASAPDYYRPQSSAYGRLADEFKKKGKKILHIIFVFVFSDS